MPFNAMLFELQSLPTLTIGHADGEAAAGQPNQEQCQAPQQPMSAEPKSAPSGASPHPGGQCVYGRNIHETLCSWVLEQNVVILDARLLAVVAEEAFNEMYSMVLIHACLADAWQLIFRVSDYMQRSFAAPTKSPCSNAKALHGRHQLCAMCVQPLGALAACDVQEELRLEAAPQWSRGRPEHPSPTPE